jgi:archaellum component FlaF (FlaF/FlaG flagellin family)
MSESLGKPTEGIKIFKKRAGFATVISTAILIGAVSVMGSVVLIWANTTFTAQQRTIGEYYEDNSNLLKENFVIEDVWLNKVPANYVNITMRNVGDAAIKVKEIKISGFKSDGSEVSDIIVVPTFTCQGSPQHCSLPQNSDGLLSTKQTLRADVNYTWKNTQSPEDPQAIKTLDIQVMTTRGSIEKVSWKVT